MTPAPRPNMLRMLQGFVLRRPASLVAILLALAATVGLLLLMRHDSLESSGAAGIAAGGRPGCSGPGCPWQPKRLARLMSPPHTPIPHIIHQSWKTVNLPVKFQKWQTSWRKHHPGWEYRLWTDDDNMRFCEEHYPWFLERFKSYPQNINRADAVRYMYLHKFGGVYADLDVECLKPHEPIAQLGGIVMPLMSYDYNFEHNIPNAWMASAPGHPFWIYLLERMNKMKLEGGVEAATGPVVLYRALREFETKLYNETMPPITYLSRELIFPYDWHNSQPYSTFCSSQSAFINTTRCKQTIDPDHRAYTITYWSHSWGDGDALISLPEGHHLTPKQIPQQ